MAGQNLTDWVISCLLLGLRVAPVFAFAPPFTLVPLPRLFLVLFGLGVSASLVAVNPQATHLADSSLYGIALAALKEAALGSICVLAFQLVFGALYLAGRTVDIQAGFGFALLIDPKSQAQVPMVGTIFAYLAGAAFFSFDGHVGLLRLLATSLQAVPLGSWTIPGSLEALLDFTSGVFLASMGFAGAAILTLFLIDMMIALLSRTVPQMNVLVLGFQVKTIALLLVLPVSLGLGGALLLRLMAETLQSLPRMF